MKTLRIVSMVIMVMVTAFFIVFAQIQRGYAEEAQQRAKEQEQLAISNLEEVVAQKKIAEEQTAMAWQAELRAIQLKTSLENCKNQ